MPLVLLMLAAAACNLPLLPSTTPTPTAATFTPTPSPTPLPTATPTPTPLPSDLLEIGYEALRLGDPEGALLAFQAALSVAPDDDIATRAILGLGKAHLQSGAHATAASTFRDLLERFPDSPFAGEAHFHLARALAAAGEPLAGAEHYRAYLEQPTPIAAYVQEWLGDALHAGGDYPGAAAAYQAAVEAAPDLAFEVGLREKLALAHVAQEDYDAALAQYDAILDKARIPGYRARIGHQAAQTLLLAGRTAEAYSLHLEVVETYTTDPRAYPWPYESLVVLVEAGVSVDDLTRGTVDYYGGAYGPAVTALYRYVNTYPATHLGDAHYYAGLAHLEAGSPALAEDQFRILIETHPGNTYWDDGWMGLAQAQAAQGDVPGAVDTYGTFAATAPGHPRAPEALWAAAQLLERAGDLQAAAAAYDECQAAHPNSDYAAPALLRGGLQHFQLRAVQRAATDWQTLADRYPGSPYQAAAFLWLGKSHLVAGQPLSATVAFSRAIQVDPTDYYGLRAADLLVDSSAPPFPAARYVPLPDDAGGQAEAEVWLADWLALPSTDSPGELGPALADDPRLQRGLELWQLDRLEEAKTELEALREATKDDPLAQYQLALLFRDIGLYRSSISAASTLVRLSPAATAMDVPQFLARLVYPTYYEDLVLSNAAAEDVNPLVLFALIRQESLFESFATSYAFAYGLTQVIPSTGDYIASNLGWPPDYDASDLYRPLVSVRFGTWYLARQRDRFDGRLDVALAAYNGGPGNAQIWLDAAGSDPDLFLELITLGEPRLYLQRIREHYAAYTALYGP